MTTTQEVLWTALPWGRDPDGRPRISVAVSPRLRTDESPPRLGLFDEFPQWPDAVSGMTFSVAVKGVGGEISTERLSSAADATLWGHLFTDDTFVRPFEFKDHSVRNIRSFPVHAVMTYLGNLYQTIAQLSPDDLPLLSPENGQDPAGTLLGLIQEVGDALWHFRLPRDREGLGQLLETQEFDFKALGIDPWATDEPDRAIKEAARERRFRALDPAFANAQVVDPGANPGTFGFTSQAAMDFYQAHRFYDRPEDQHPYLPEPKSELIPDPPKVPEIDFHQMVAALGDYPVLLRRLGLVVDLAIEGDLPATGEIRIRPQRGDAPPLATDRTPWTSYELTADRFVARALDPAELSGGVLALDGANDDFEGGGAGGRFSVMQVDADGAALKAVNMAVELRSLLFDISRDAVSFDTPERTGLPPMRSVGVGIFRKERAVQVHERLEDAATRNGAADLNEVVNSAEHLIRGYRVDVFVDGQWRSLNERRGTYRIHRPAGPPIEVTEPNGSPIEDEGYIKAASTTSSDDQNSDLYLHETMFSWDGWSPVAKRPGRTIYPKTSPDGLHQEEEVDLRPPELATEFKLETSFRPVPGSLPRLRFGKTYRFRARAVDLAGNSVGVDEADDSHASGEIFYARFDPVLPPTLVPRAAMTEGESIERMVIRSNFDRTADEYAAELDPGGAYSATNDRHVVPPKTSQQMAETHGELDGAFGPGGNPATAFDIAVREAATLEHTHVVVPGSDPVEYEKVPGSAMIEGTLPPDAPGDAQAQGAYLINTQPLFPLAYLPDVLARGAAFRGLPGGDEVDLREFTGDWPDATPIVLRIAESPGVVEGDSCAEALAEEGKPLHWDDESRILTVFLPKATIAVVRYSSYLSGDDLEVMAAWRRWMEGAADEATLKKLAATGGHWMLTPFRELALVHAVQQPLCPPVVRLESWRGRGAMFAELQGLAHLSVRSTGQLDLEAAWTEWIDNLSDPGPKELPGRSQVASLRVDPWLPEQDPFPPIPDNPDGTSPIPQHGGLALPFPALSDLPPGTQFTDPQGEGFMEVDHLPEFRKDAIKHEFGDTKHRWVRYHLVGTTRFREYLPAPIGEDRERITRSGEDVRVNILSSARPDAPRVRYLVPSFRWEQDPAPDVEQWTRFERTRVGGGLRVWMDRPWYSSGDEERLGAVLWPGSVPPEQFSKLVSQFGADPAWRSAIPSVGLRPNHFANAADSDHHLILEEAPGATRFEVAAFDVEYRGGDRNLWFCDIDLRPKAGPSYFPFVRLALARYQRHSIDNAAKLSRVVQTDFHQLLPDRTLTVTFRAPKTVDVTVWGPAPSDPIRNRVEVLVEHHDGTIPGDLGWKPVPSKGAWRNPVHLSDGAPDVSWIPPDIPEGLASASELRTRAVRVERPATRRISEANLPLIPASEISSLVEIDAGLIHGIDSLPVFALPGYELWSGTVQLPDDDSLGPLRLLVREFEHFRADPDVGRIDRDRHDPHIEGPFLDRVVYADIVELPPS